jgi:hypothetical protein
LGGASKLGGLFTHVTRDGSKGTIVRGGYFSLKTEVKLPGKAKIQKITTI